MGNPDASPSTAQPGTNTSGGRQLTLEQVGINVTPISGKADWLEKPPELPIAGKRL